MGPKNSQTMTARRPSALVFGLAGAMLAIAAAATAGPGGGGNPTPDTVEITLIENLRFGAMVVGGVSGTVTMAPDGSRTATGGVALMTSPPAGAASFRVTKTGASSKALTIILPTTVTLNGPSGASMTAVSFTSTPASGVRIRAGDTLLQMGATLQLNANQPPGTYSGVLEVIVDLGG